MICSDVLGCVMLCYDVLRCVMIDGCDKREILWINRKTIDQVSVMHIPYYSVEVFFIAYWCSQCASFSLNVRECFLMKHIFHSVQGLYVLPRLFPRIISENLFSILVVQVNFLRGISLHFLLVTYLAQFLIAFLCASRVGFDLIRRQLYS